MATVNLNKLASALCGENTKVRIRVQDGEIQIRPTNRTAGGLPKGEMLVDLREKKQAVRALRFTLPVQFEAPLGSMFRAEVRKSGWVALVRVAEKAPLVPGQAAPAGASVSDR